VRAEAQHDAELIRLDPEEAGEAPHHERGQRDENDTLAAEPATRQHALELVLAAPQQILEVRRGRPRRLRPRAPRPFVVAARAPGTAALIAPWHSQTSPARRDWLRPGAFPWRRLYGTARFLSTQCDAAA